MAKSADNDESHMLSHNIYVHIWLGMCFSDFGYVGLLYYGNVSCTTSKGIWLMQIKNLFSSTTIS